MLLGRRRKRILSSKIALASNEAHSQQGQPNKTLFQKKKESKEVEHSPVSKRSTGLCPESARLKEKMGKFSVHFSDPCERTRRTTTETVCVTSVPKCEPLGKERKARSSLVAALA